MTPFDLLAAELRGAGDQPCRWRLARVSCATILVLDRFPIVVISPRAFQMDPRFKYWAWNCSLTDNAVTMPHLIGTTEIMLLNGATYDVSWYFVGLGTTTVLYETSQITWGESISHLALFA